MCAATDSGVQRAPSAWGSTVQPAPSNSMPITPLIGRVEQSAPHSPILAPCQAAPACSPLISGSAEIAAVSVARPAITTFAPVRSAAAICSAPANATICVQPAMSSAEMPPSGAPASGASLPASRASTTDAAGCSDFSVATLRRRPPASAMARVAASMPSTVASVPQVPAEPSTSGQPAAARAASNSCHSDRTEASEYFETPAPR